MEVTMEFTNAEQERINQLYGNDFADIQPDDAKLIARWESWKATQNLDYQAKVEALKTQMQANVQYSEALADKAMENLADLRDAAMARLERLG